MNLENGFRDARSFAYFGAKPGGFAHSLTQGGPPNYWQDLLGRRLTHFLTLRHQTTCTDIYSIGCSRRMRLNTTTNVGQADNGPHEK
jgi:hypothetical protein